jgi:hypothetical protein
MFSHSFYNLTIAGQVSDGRNLRKSNYPPRALGSGASSLPQRLTRQGATARELKLIRLWLDSGAVYAGTYAALGTGSVGDYSAHRLTRPDLKWASTKKAQAVLKRRCGGCHKGKTALPTSPSDNKGLVPWGEGPMNALARHESQRYNPVFRFNRHLLYNLSRPDKSLLLLAPLAPEAGGFAKARDASEAEATRKCPAVFNSTSDPDYQALLAAIQDTKDYLDRVKRFDMPGFQPRPEYVRELKRYGILPASFDLGKDALDVYAIERRYWKSQWYHPPNPSGKSR